MRIFISHQSQTAIYKIRPLAEFETIKMIMLSEFLVNDKTDGIGFINAIQNAGAEVLMLKNRDNETVDTNSNEKQNKFSQVKKLEKLHQSTMLHESYWLRDFGPIQLEARKKSGASEQFAANFFYNGNELDDTLPFQAAVYFGSSVLNLSIQLDGGNFLSNGESCLMTADYKLNDIKVDLADRKQNLDRHANLRSYLAENIGCKYTIVIESSPHPHIDMFAKFLNKETLLIADIPENALYYLKDKLGSYEEILKIKIRLDEIAEQLSLDFKIERLPMPMPYGKLFRSYTNSLLVNNTAIIPSYRKNALTGERYIDDELLVAFEVDVEHIYRRHGYNVVFLPADDLIKGGGAWRCVSIPIFELQDKINDYTHNTILSRLFDGSLSKRLF
ncbi:MAG: agmatine deiminase family protein [Oligoflexales bacterium]|nr:agmatine deiminase family protein [Oligoflexales bacterium]